MLDIVLLEPQIASNTGSIIRLCANVGGRLHLVKPLGFTLDGAALRRGGLDYHELTETTVWDSWAECRAGVGADRHWYATTAGTPNRRYDEVEYAHDDVVVFGCEAEGLPAEVLVEFDVDHRLHIPMRPDNRSINLANAVSIVVYEAWRQHGFEGAASGTFAESRPALPPDP